MGTRHLIAVMQDGEYKVAQYGQWDGYPAGQGTRILKFLKHLLAADPDPIEDIHGHTKTMDQFREKVKQTTWITAEEYNQVMETVAPGSSTSGMMNMAQSEKFEAEYPELHRNTGYEILELIVNSEWPLKINNSISFAADSLFCEWAYVIDLDKNTFEVYKGFNREPLAAGERFENIESDRKTNDEYFPVRLVKSFPFAELPWDTEFINETDPEIDEDEE